MCKIDLRQGNCLEVLKTLPDGSVDLIITDPPYLIKNISGGGSVNNVKKLNKSLQDLEQSDLIQGYDIPLFNSEFVRVMKEINIYIFCNKAQIPEYLDFYVGKHKCKFDIISWHKTNALPTYSNKYLSDTEYVLYFRKGSGKCFPQSYEDAKTYYISPINHRDKKLYGHPTCKPVDLLRRFIRTSSRPGQVVLDPFLGSGSTGCACVLEGQERAFLGIELDYGWYSVASSRIAQVVSEASECDEN